MGLLIVPGCGQLTVADGVWKVLTVPGSMWTLSAHLVAAVWIWVGSLTSLSPFGEEDAKIVALSQGCYEEQVRQHLCKHWVSHTVNMVAFDLERPACRGTFSALCPRAKCNWPNILREEGLSGPLGRSAYTCTWISRGKTWSTISYLIKGAWQITHLYSPSFDKGLLAFTLNFVF